MATAAMLQQFIQKVGSREATIGVVGLGYVGLPLALRFAESGFDTIGFDIDKAKIDTLHAGGSYIKTVPPERVAAARREPSGFHVMTDFDQLSECDAVLMCVPTPLGKNREPDMSYVEQTTAAVRLRLRKGQLVVLESTTYPGTTDELVCPLLEHDRTGEQFRVGADFWLAYSPEREDPGNANFHTQTIPKLVGGLTPDCLSAAVALYSAVLDKVVPVKSTRVAEMAKLYENIFRGVNIALVNELKMVCDAMDIDVWEVVDAAATKPFGFMRFTPGPGLGGHCIPIDPFYLTWKAHEYGLSTRFIELAGEVNTAMPRYVLDRLVWALNEWGHCIRGSSILVVGVAYKRDVDDMRESPALPIIDMLTEAGALVAYHDPHVQRIVPTRHYDIHLASSPLTRDLVREQDACIIITDHTGVDYDLLLSDSHIIIDTRNVMAGRSGLSAAWVVKA